MVLMRNFDFVCPAAWIAAGVLLQQQLVAAYRGSFNARKQDCLISPVVYLHGNTCD
jgi:hypothetical protein